MILPAKGFTLWAGPARLVWLLALLSLTTGFDTLRWDTHQQDGLVHAFCPDLECLLLAAETSKSGGPMYVIPKLLHRSHKFTTEELFTDQPEDDQVSSMQRTRRNVARCAQLNPDTVTIYYDDVRAQDMIRDLLRNFTVRPSQRLPSEGCASSRCGGARRASPASGRRTAASRRGRHSAGRATRGGTSRESPY
jgi:hypothetical protein